MAFGNCSEPVEVVVVDPRLLVGVDPTGLLGEVVSIGVLVGVGPTGPSGGVYPVGILVGVVPIGTSLGVEPAGLFVGVGAFGLLPLGCPKVLMLVVTPVEGKTVGVVIGVVVSVGVTVDGSGELTWRPNNSWGFSDRN